MMADLKCNAEHASMIAEAITFAIEGAENDCGNNYRMSLWLLLIDAAARDISRILTQDVAEHQPENVAPQTCQTPNGQVRRA